MKMLFLGDSITDWFRDHNDEESLGKGYVSFAAKALHTKYPALKFQNAGVNGYSTEKVAELIRDLEPAEAPSIVSVLVGVNDFCSINKPNTWVPSFAATTENYRQIFRTIRQRFHAEILVLQPYLAGEYHPYFTREHLTVVHEKLAAAMRDEGVTNCVPLDLLINDAFPGARAGAFSKDGVHPLPEGAAFLGKLVAEYAAPLIEKENTK